MSRLSYHTNEVLVEYSTLKILSGSIWATGRRASASCSASAASASGRWSTSSSSPSDMLDRPMDLCTSEKQFWNAHRTFLFLLLCRAKDLSKYKLLHAKPLFCKSKLGEFFSSIYFYRLRKIACCVSHSSKINFIKQNKPFHQKKVQHINVA